MRTLRLAFLLSFVLAIPAAYAGVHVTPSQIPAVIEDHLEHAGVNKHGQVQVAFADGTATLTGTVDSVGVKMDAERATRKMEDVLQVVNQIQVRTEDTTDRQIVEEARKAVVTYYTYSIFDSVSLSSESNRLVVSGEVTQPYKKEDIGNFLAHLKGVVEVENRLEVLPLSNYDDNLRMAIARAIYNDPYFIHYATQPYPPIHIIVKNGNVTLDGVVGNKLDRIKAENDARFAATFFALANNLRVEG